MTDPAEGLPAYFTQTGGMCAAIEVTLEPNHYLLVTDADDSLAWTWAEHKGWMVGIYRSPSEGEADYDYQEPLRLEVIEDGSPEALPGLIREVLSRRPDEPTE